MEWDELLMDWRAAASIQIKIWKDGWIGYGLSSRLISSTNSLSFHPFNCLLFYWLSCLMAGCSSSLSKKDKKAREMKRNQLFFNWWSGVRSRQRSLRLITHHFFISFSPLVFSFLLVMRLRLICAAPSTNPKLLVFPLLSCFAFT